MAANAGLVAAGPSLRAAERGLTAAERSTPMTILTFNYEYPPVGGGGGIAHAMIAEELARRHKVFVITSAWDGLPSREVRQGVDIHRVRVLGRGDQWSASLTSMATFVPVAWRHAARMLRQNPIDVVHAHFAVPTGAASLPVARFGEVPHVLSLHGGDIYDPSKRMSPHRWPAVRQVVERVLSGSDAVVAQSSDTRRNTYRYYRYRGAIEVIPFAVRQPEVEPADRTQLGLPRDAFLGVTVGRLVPRKRIDQLFVALAAQSCSTVHLVVVGDGPERAHLRNTARSLGIDDRVTFTGYVSEERKWQILRCCDLYVSSTQHEGFGLTFLEAMTEGLPVVTFDHGGHTDFLENGRTGYLIQAGNTEALANAIGSLAADRQCAARLGRESRRRADAYSAERCARRYEELFRRVIGHGARGIPSL